MNPRQTTRTRAMDQINITPLADVCLVILLIFMVVTPLLVPGHAVKLPEAANGGPQPEEKRALILSVDASGGLYLGEKHLDLQQLGDSLRGAHAENPERPVRLMGDAKAPFGEVKGALRATQGAGFRGIALIIKQRSEAVLSAVKSAEESGAEKEVSHDR